MPPLWLGRESVLMPSIREVVWLAGLLEGEGSFGLRKTGKYQTLNIQLGMTDLDVVEKAAKILGTEVRGPYGPYGTNKLPWYSVSVNGWRAVSWMMTLWSLMGSRRKKKIEALLTKWRSYPSRPRRPASDPNLPINCPHTDHESYSRGLCRPCYMREYHRKRKSNAHPTA
jgi:hypothetical protein